MVGVRNALYDRGWLGARRLQGAVISVGNVSAGGSGKTPFVLLLMRGIKRQADRLLKVCLLMIAIRLVDVYWVVEPSFYNQQLKLHWMDFVTPVAVGGLWLAAFFWQLKSRPLVPLRDRRLQGAPRETVSF